MTPEVPNFQGAIKRQALIGESSLLPLPALGAALAPGGAALAPGGAALAPRPPLAIKNEAAGGPPTSAALAPGGAALAPGGAALVPYEPVAPPERSLVLRVSDESIPDAPKANSLTDLVTSCEQAAAENQVCSNDPNCENTLEFWAIAVSESLAHLNA